MISREYHEVFSISRVQIYSSYRRIWLQPIDHKIQWLNKVSDCMVDSQSLLKTQDRIIISFYKSYEKFNCIFKSDELNISEEFGLAEDKKIFNLANNKQVPEINFRLYCNSFFENSIFLATNRTNFLFSS